MPSTFTLPFPQINREGRGWRKFGRKGISCVTMISSNDFFEFCYTILRPNFDFLDKVKFKKSLTYNVITKINNFKKVKKVCCLNKKNIK